MNISRGVKFGLVFVLLFTMRAALPAQAAPALPVNPASAAADSVPNALTVLPASAVSMGYEHACALTSAGGVRCWGANGDGQLGDGSSEKRLTPVDVSGLESGVTAISLGGYFSCALTSQGAVKCWGDNSNGQLGDDSGSDQSIPVGVTGLNSGVIAIDAGEEHACALLADGSMMCWGANYYGELGDNSTINQPKPVEVTILGAPASAVSAGSYHTCAILAGGLKCWGYNQNGELGNNSTTDSKTAVQVDGLTSGVTAVSAGMYHSCAILSGGALKCWGSNSNGQLGNDSTTNSLLPVQVSGLTSGVSAVDTFGEHTCAVVSGKVHCWGYNYYGQLGQGDTQSSSLPLEVPGISHIKTLAVGSLNTCALTIPGGLHCWGNQSDGVLGNGVAHVFHTPQGVIDLTGGVTRISAGNYHTCALTSDGAVKCWGENEFGQLGDGTVMRRSTPVQVSGLTSGVTAIESGDGHTCALLSSGAVQCWGYNDFGQLGDGTHINRRQPVQVSGLTSGVIKIAAGSYHTCAILTGGAVKCWGENHNGQLGTGNTSDSEVPVDATALTNTAINLSAGSSHTCAIVSGNALKCWGYNANGQLGDNSTTDSLTPVNVSFASTNITQTTAHYNQSCLLNRTGAAACWGFNGYGQLGDQTETDKKIPTQVYRLTSDVQSIKAGQYHTCAILSGNTARCWGDNEYGKLGDGTTIRRTSPVQVSGLTSGVTAISPGGVHTCAVVAGAVKCWGNNQNGVVGSVILWRPVKVVSFDPLAVYLPMVQR